MADKRRGMTTPRNALISQRDSSAGSNSENSDLSAFVRHLEKRYSALVAAHARERDEPEFRNHLFSLQLGAARLDKDGLSRRHPDLSAQIALLGPTQAGKSSLVNWLLGQNLAEVSPLAGFTVHPHGFCWGCPEGQTNHVLATFFHAFRRFDPENLPRDRLDAYTLEATSAPPSLQVPAACLWDTPDFDSVDSESYRSSLLRIVGLADVIVLVLSKDKYSDQSVWDMVGLLQPLGHPTVIVLNKVDAGAREVLLSSLEEKWRAARSDAFPFVVTIPFLDLEEASCPPPTSLETLTGWIRQDVASMDHSTQRHRTKELLQRHWTAWLTPVRAEHEARSQWRAAVADATKEALARYQREYLEHPHHYETFQRALARLLTLLEIPGVAGLVATARQVLTWPFRQVSTIGRHLRSPSAEDDPKSGEQSMIEQIAEHLLLQLNQMAFAKRDTASAAQDWWNDLAVVLRAALEETKQGFRVAHGEYARSFQPEIDRTARELYERLEARPVILNSLRATRITTDAAALALALHTGGIGIQDFVIAPATLSLTSMLTESALGRYVNHAAEELKVRQLAAVRGLFEQALREPLEALPDRLDLSRRFNISPSVLAQAEALLATYA